MDDISQLEEHERRIDADLVEAARRDVNVYIECVGRYQWSHHPDGRRIEPHERLLQHDVHLDIQEQLRRHPWLMVKSFPSSGKTTQVALNQTWQLGHDTGRRVVVASLHVREGDPSTKHSNIMRQAIEDPFTSAVFPNLRRVVGQWGKKTWSVERTKSTAADDPTFRTIQLSGSITGGRPNAVVIDDLYDDTVVRSEADARRILSWVQMTLLGRFGINPDTQVIWLTNAWHDRDPSVLLRERMREQGYEDDDPDAPWHFVDYPLVDSHGHSLHPSLIPDEAIPALKAKNRDKWAQLFELKTIADEDRAFTVEVLDKAFRDDVLPVERVDPDEFEGLDLIVGVDPATGSRRRKKKSDLHSLCAIVGDYSTQRFRQLWIESVREPVEKLAWRILEWQLRYWPSEFCVEENLAAGWLKHIVELEFEAARLRAKLTGEYFKYVMPTITYRWTGRDKWDDVSGVRALVSEFQDGRHMFPSTRRESGCRKALIRQRDGFFGFTDSSHTADEVMAYWVGRERHRERARRRAIDQQHRATSQSGVKSFPLRTPSSRENPLPGLGHSYSHLDL